MSSPRDSTVAEIFASRIMEARCSRLGADLGEPVTVQVYPKAVIGFAIIVALGLLVGAWSVAAAWRIGMITVIAALIVQRFRHHGKRITTKF
jgi:uncharacterized membrane protein YphA (DoxX/SURF4 family)